VGQVRTFILVRNEDKSGVSGTGLVAEGCEFTDGTVAMRWVTGDHRATAVWENITAVKAIHGHGGKTKIHWAEDGE